MDSLSFHTECQSLRRNLKSTSRKVKGVYGSITYLSMNASGKKFCVSAVSVYFSFLRRHSLKIKRETHLRTFELISQTYKDEFASGGHHTYKLKGAETRALASLAIY